MGGADYNFSLDRFDYGFEIISDIIVTASRANIGRESFCNHGFFICALIACVKLETNLMIIHLPLNVVTERKTQSI